MFVSPIRRFRSLYRRGLLLAIVASLAVIVGALTWATKIALHHEHFTLYFDANVHGLSVGSPVIMNGQNIGQVCDIYIVAKPDWNGVRHFYPAVSIVVDTQKLHKIGRVGSDKSARDSLPLLVALGLRGKLQMPSMLASGLSVSLYLDPKTPAFTLDLPNASAPEIPTDFHSSSDYIDSINAFLNAKAPSKIAENIHATREAAERLQKSVENIDFKALNDKALAQTGNLNAVLVPARISSELSRANASIVSFCESAEKYRDGGNPPKNAEEFCGEVRHFSETLKNIRGEARTLRALLAPEETENRLHLLREMRKQNESLIRFVEDLLF